MDFAEAQGASMIVRGLRAVADFEYEYQMAGMNQQLNADIETVFLMADVSLQPIASKLVKEIAMYGGDIGRFVTPAVAEDVRQRVDRIGRKGRRLRLRLRSAASVSLKRIEPELFRAYHALEKRKRSLTDQALEQGQIGNRVKFNVASVRHRRRPVRPFPLRSARRPGAPAGRAAAGRAVRAAAPAAGAPQAQPPPAAPAPPRPPVPGRAAAAAAPAENTWNLDLSTGGRVVDPAAPRRRAADGRADQGADPPGLLQRPRASSA